MNEIQKLGRNDRCHCGSGKKYKHCHLKADQLAKFNARPRPVPAEAPSAPLNLGQLQGVLQRLAEQDSMSGQTEFSELLAQTKPLLDYVRREDEIEAAAAKLEPYRTEFDSLSKDPKAYMARTEALFKEECFAPMRFTVADVKRSFDKVGYPPTVVLADETLDKLRDAILFLATKERRASLAMCLYLRLPDFVAAGRYLDGWIIQVCAHATGEFGDEPNPFLFQMFVFGYDAWMAEGRAQGELLLRDMGVSPDRLRGMTPGEIDEWLAAQKADPAKSAVMDAFFHDPAQRSAAIANVEALEHNCVTILERPDARVLFLAPEELEPWLPALTECAKKLQAAQSKSADPGAPNPQFAQDLLLPLVREMAKSIFTRQRIERLISQLRIYRNEHFAAEDKTVANYATAAMAYLERENEPGLNRFLGVLCLASLRSPDPDIEVGGDLAPQ